MLVPKSPFNLERLQREVNILLLSDLHYDVKKEMTKEKWMKGRNVNNRIINSLKSQPAEWEPDIVIVAGDLVNHNKAENYPHFVDLIRKLTGAFSNLRNAYFSTPGNHDINRENIVSIFPYLYQLKQAEPELEMEDSFTNSQVVDAIYTISKKSIKDHTSLGDALVKFEKEYFKTYLIEQRKLYKRILHKHAKEEIFKGIETVYCKSLLGVTLLSLNSSFFCNVSQTGTDRNNLFLIRDLVEEVDCKLKSIPRGPIITFMHHPYYYLHESEHIAPASLSLEDKQNNFTKLVKKSDLILSGHVHGELHDPTLLQQNAYMITNGTSYTTDSFEEKCYPYTYALIKINKQLGKFSMRKFKYLREEKKKKVSYAFSYINGEDPCKSYRFFEREGTEGTTVETEKIRVLDYYKNYYLAIKEYSELYFFIYQLRLYNKALADSTIRYKHKKIVHAGSGFMIDSVSYRGNNTIWIFQMNDINYQRDMETILSGKTCDCPNNCMIYFSVKMDLLFDKGIPSPRRIEHLRETFQSLVMSMKNEKASINLLYH